MAAPTDYIAYYKLENDANDETGNYNGVNTGAVFDGTSATFDGNDHIVLQSGVTSGDNSWSVWAKENTISTDAESIIGQRNADTSSGYVRGLYNYDGLIHYFSRDSSNTYNYLSYAISNENKTKWHHIVAQQFGTIIKLYIDGEFKLLKDMGSTHLFDSQVAIGEDPRINGLSQLDGSVSHFRLYNRALTAQEILDIYNEEYSKFYNYKNIDSSNGYIEATGTDGYAISQPIVQDAGDTDFTSVQNIVGKYELANISIADTADELKTNELIKDGDNLVIVKDDNSIHEIVASDVAIKCNNIPTDYIAYYKFETDENDETGNYNGTVNGSTTTFDGTKANFVDDSSFISTPIFNLGTSWSISLWFKFDTIPDYPNIIGGGTADKYFTLMVYNGGLMRVITGDGSNWNSTYADTPTGTISTNTLYNVILTSNNGLVNIYLDNGNSIGSATFTQSLNYQLNFGLRYAECVSDYYFDGTMSDIHIYDYPLTLEQREEVYYYGYQKYYNNIYTMDTTSATSGEVPIKVFRNDESVFFNSNETTFVSNSYTAGTPLLVDKAFNTVQTQGREIETKVQMSATGNKMTDLDFDIYKEP